MGSIGILAIFAAALIYHIYRGKLQQAICILAASVVVAYSYCLWASTLVIDGWAFALVVCGGTILGRATDDFINWKKRKHGQRSPDQ